jgi:hypothetical protein
MIADNRLSEIASWDDQLLGESLKELATLSLDFATEATGFEMNEIDLRIEALEQQAGGKDDRRSPTPSWAGPSQDVTRLWALAHTGYLVATPRPRRSPTL